MTGRELHAIWDETYRQVSKLPERRINYDELIAEARAGWEAVSEAMNRPQTITVIAHVPPLNACACGNTARYIDEKGRLTCGICPIKNRLDSIKISDVGKLLVLLRGFSDWIERTLSFVDVRSLLTSDALNTFNDALRELIGRKS